MNQSPIGLKIPNWPLTEVEFKEFLASLNELLSSIQYRPGVREGTIPVDGVGRPGDLFVVETGGAVKIYGKGRTLGWKSVSLA